MSPLDYQSFNFSTQVALRLQLKFKSRGQVILLQHRDMLQCNHICHAVINADVIQKKDSTHVHEEMMNQLIKIN